MRDEGAAPQGRVLAEVRLRASDLPLGIGEPVALAFIAGVDGPSYRPVGAAMAIGPDAEMWGSLSSGCIDADVARHAREVAASGQPRDLRYGAGSPFRDLELPCGGGLDIRVIAVPDASSLAPIRSALAGRRPINLWLGRTLSTTPADDAVLRLRVDPDPRFAVFGKGPEALAFARMAAGAGYETHLASPDAETLAIVGPPIRGVHLVGPLPLERVPVDAFTAGVLFFHDHDHEPAILAHLLQGPAFYVGAQGSRRAAAERLRLLRAAGLAEDRLARLRGPIGLIPSTRDARTLAASVLAEVLAVAMQDVSAG
ncbi:XdhC family protein [Paracoccus sp. NGMCC 1.201697]|uniref:XdhC family protein n=1 Tax=Paracoccus broussonetiae subsp. drimophilus TaxID=3373869 RepID=A0ABW7LJ84_9RHOB